MVQTEQRIRNREFKTEFKKGSTGTSAPKISSESFALFHTVSQDSPYSTTIFIIKK